MKSKLNDSFISEVVNWYVCVRAIRNQVFSFRCLRLFIKIERKKICNNSLDDTHIQTRHRRSELLETFVCQNKEETQFVLCFSDIVDVYREIIASDCDRRSRRNKQKTEIVCCSHANIRLMSAKREKRAQTSASSWAIERD